MEMQTRQGVARNWVYVAGLVGVLFIEFLLLDVFLRSLRPAPMSG